MSVLLKKAKKVVRHACACAVLEKKVPNQFLGNFSASGSAKGAKQGEVFMSERLVPAIKFLIALQAGKDGLRKLAGHFDSFDGSSKQVKAMKRHGGEFLAKCCEEGKLEQVTKGGAK